MLRPLLALAVFAPLVLAQAPDRTRTKDDAEAEKKQKALAAENMKQLKVPKPTLVETEHVLAYADLPEEKVKPIAEAAEKAHERAYKDLKFGEKDRMWAGKLTLYVLADRSKEYTPFVKLVEQRGGKLDADEMQTVSVKGGEPYAAVTAAPGSKTADADLRAEAVMAAAVAVANQKAGVTLPTWLQSAVGKAVVLRSEGGKGLEAHRTRVKALFTKTKVGLFKVGDVWGDMRGKDYDTLTVSFGEYLLYGADAEAAGKFLGGFRPSEERREPTTAQALDDAGWKADTLDAAWKAWVMKQK